MPESFLNSAKSYVRSPSTSCDQEPGLQQVNSLGMPSDMDSRRVPKDHGLRVVAPGVSPVSSGDAGLDVALRTTGAYRLD